jgi:hypothetical protein
MSLSLRAIIVVTAACFVLLLVLAANSIREGMATLSEPVAHGQAGFAGSAVCRECHDDRHASWYATYHRTMTREASGDTVQGRFDGQALDYWGVRVRPVRQGGRYYFEYYDLDSDALIDRYRVYRTVGSNRYQQYLTRLDDGHTYVRLHYLWHGGDQRWVHMNAAFLGPDAKPFDNHVAIWNQNCIFCHNTGPVPNMTNYDDLTARAQAGMPVNMGRDSRFESEVAELGISCESCHGPGEIHVERGRDRATRLAMRLRPGRDTSIINPVRLDHDRASQVCGQCHAQRMPAEPDMLHDWVHGGPTYRPGMDLHEHITPIWRDTRAPIHGQEDMFELRFWNDGSPRLTAYEYQGLLQSPCHQQAELTCMDCHTMHAGDPAGQLTDRNRTNAPCLRCHQDFRGQEALAEHTRHQVDGPGSQCYNCHMPHMVYGVMDIHRSHRIENPDARRDAEAGRPNACLNCHMEQTPEWAQTELAEWSGQAPHGPLMRHDGADASMSDAVTLLAGDPVQKAVAAWRTGHEHNYQRGRERAWLVPYLLEAMADIYPSSRRFAHHGLLAVLQDWPEPGEVSAVAIELERFDFIASQPERERVRQAAIERWQDIDKQGWPAPPAASGVDDDFLLPEVLRSELVELGRRQDKQIAIGE